MKVVAGPEVVELVHEHGGRLYVWTDPLTCCGTVTYLRTAAEPKPGRVFHRVANAGFELFIAHGRIAPPEELHLEMRGWRRRRIEASWDRCAYVT